MKNTFCVLVCFFITIFCQAQSVEEHYYFKNLSIRNGLSQNTVNAILQDRKGFMWLGTKDGLNRYDGLSFRKFKHDAANPRSIGNSFIFLLLEGFQYTHNRFRYIGRLLLFAAISEIPFDLAVNLSAKLILRGHFLEFTSQNVFFTLAIGMIVLTALEGLRTLQMDTILKTILIVGVVAFGAALAYALHTDYGAVGVLAICTAYGFQNQKKELRMAAPCVVLSVLNMSELCALVDAGIVHYYNGKRGLKLKWVFYIFYPLHLLILAGICVLLFK